MGVIIEIYVSSILDAIIINLILWAMKIQYIIVLNQEFSFFKMFIKNIIKLFIEISSSVQGRINLTFYGQYFQLQEIYIYYP